ncbi:hypothetical protein HPP92_021291 [Vanilla planifolia]|uniref:ABC1 atypical kinase-like domain-containing protein n=1 Tax=Vanilla planifolia TaxID=51239 RepID=A0A835Q0T7_VANPL|nr:hypothetical protein HPP92_021291 [Vanilla planifolia]
MRERAVLLKFAAKTRVSLLLAGGVSCVGLACQANPSFFADESTLSSSADGIFSALDGVVRTSRAIYVISSIVFDYKYSFRWLPPGSTEYRSMLPEVKPCNIKGIKDVISKSLGKDCLELFLTFDEKPVAAASIAQVHHGTLKNNQEVAIKRSCQRIRDSVKWLEEIRMSEENLAFDREKPLNERPRLGRIVKAVVVRENCQK